MRLTTIDHILCEREVLLPSSAPPHVTLVLDLFNDGLGIDEALGAILVQLEVARILVEHRLIVELRLAGVRKGVFLVTVQDAVRVHHFLHVWTHIVLV
mmetsp:Transcript_3053/g.4126  ORF Transcript_3053/g.4126 Transcript_3053/m.4126 type:complete len:98 (-) Transcript_3053:1441-1734(-)